MINGKMTFWQMIKAGFALAFGGRLGWMLGGFIGGLFTRLFKFVWLGLAGFGFAVGAQYLPDYKPTKNPSAAHAQQHKEAGQKVVKTDAVKIPLQGDAK